MAIQEIENLNCRSERDVQLGTACHQHTNDVCDVTFMIFTYTHNTHNTHAPSQTVTLSNRSPPQSDTSMMSPIYEKQTSVLQCTVAHDRGNIYFVKLKFV